MNTSNSQSGIIEFVVIQPEDLEEILEFIRQNYYLEEPLTIGLEPKDQHDIEDEEFNISNIKYGTCLKAIEDGQIIGCILAGPKRSNEADEILKEAARLSNTKWGNILKLLANVERSANVFQRYNVNNVLHCHVLCVKSDKRGKSLGIKLLMALMDLARNLNYELITADCTSFYSARLCEKLHWDCVNTLYYKDYEGDDGEPIFKPPSPHISIKTYAVRLASGRSSEVLKIS